MKKIFSVLLCIIIVLSVFSVFPRTVHAETSGTCGDDLRWSYEDGALTVSGTGEMYDYSWTFTSGLFITTAPWRDLYTSIETVVISHGVTTIGNEAFIGCSALTSVEIPEGVTSIGDEAFNACTSLTSITFPDSLFSIGNVAFKCTALTTVEIPDCVASIGSSAFFGCASLTSVTVGSGVTSIGNAAFSGCSALENIAVDTDNAVYRSDSNCIIETGSKTLIEGCKNTIIPSDGSVTSIGASAFSYLKSLTSIEIPDCVTSIGDFAFDNCTKLTLVNAGGGVTSIGRGVFNKCAALTSVTVPDSLVTIGDAAFDRCDSLEYNLFDNAKYLGNGSNPRVALIEASSKDIESCVIEPNTRVIYCSAFADCASLKSVEIPDSVKSIGNEAFSGCSSLISATVGGGVTSIGDDAFSGCDSLNYNLYGNAKYLGNGSDPYYALIGAASDSIESCVIRPGTILISPSAFAGCASLASVGIPGSVTSIGNRAFFGCSALTSVGIPDGVASIGISAFEGCTSLTSVTIPGSLTSAGERAFYGCDSLDAVYVTDVAAWCGISFGDYYANPLHYSRQLYLDGEYVTDLVIPEGTTTIGDFAFDGFVSLKSIVIPEGVTGIGDIAFKGCRKLVSVVVPDSVKSIGNEAFRSCTKLKSVTIGRSVISIDNNAFRACSSLETVTFSCGIKSIGDYAFYACDALKAVVFRGSGSEWDLIGKGRYNDALTDAEITFIEPINGVTVTCDGTELGAFIPGETISLPVPETTTENGAVRRFFTWRGSEVTMSAFSASNETANGRTYTMTVPDTDVCLTAEYVYVGDINGDGLITVSDIAAMKLMTAGAGTVDDKRLEAGDINFDGLNTLADLALFKPMLAG